MDQMGQWQLFVQTAATAQMKAPLHLSLQHRISPPCRRLRQEQEREYTLPTILEVERRMEHWTGLML
jgi:hypothetical protein